MRPLTLATPKPMIKICGRPLLEYIIDALPSGVDELVLVVGYLRDQIRDYFGDNFSPAPFLDCVSRNSNFPVHKRCGVRRFKITYVVQENKLGTYHALKLCEHLLHSGERFLLIYADDLHDPRALKLCAESENPSLVIDESKTPNRFGVVELAGDGSVAGIEEKPNNPKTNLVLTGVQLLTKEVMNFPAGKHSNGEYYLSDSIAQMIAAGIKVYAIKTNFWLPIGYPEDIKKAEKLLCPQSHEARSKK